MTNTKIPPFQTATIQAVAAILGETDQGLTNTEIQRVGSNQKKGTRRQFNACIGGMSQGKHDWSTDKVYSVTSEEEFSAFYEEWRRPVRQSLAMTLGNVDLADEAIDEAMTRAFTHWNLVCTYERPDGWLYRVGLNWARSVFRKRRYELLSDLLPDISSTRDLLPDPDLIEAIGYLSLKLRSVVVARYLLDMSTSEVADALQIPEGTVKSRLSRALTRLGRELGE